MEINDFVSKITELFDETDVNEIKPETIFRDLGEWSSLIGLSMMAMVDEEYNIRLKADEIRGAKTVRDLFNLILTKIDN